MMETNKELLEKIAKAGLECVTTKRQENNGTSVYHDHIANTYYGVYSSGYVRRIPSLDKKTFVVHYPVNKRCKTNSYNTYVLIHNHEDRIKRMLEAVENYRDHVSNFWGDQEASKLSTKSPVPSRSCIKEQLQEDILSILEGFGVDEAMTGSDYNNMVSALCQAVVDAMSKIDN